MSTEKISLTELKETFEVYMSEALIRAWQLYPDDKPARRLFINSYADSLIKDYNYAIMKMEFDEHNIPQDLPEYVLKEIQEREDTIDNIDNIVKSHIEWFIEDTISNLACRDDLDKEEKVEVLKRIHINVI